MNNYLYRDIHGNRGTLVRCKHFVKITVTINPNRH